MELLVLTVAILVVAYLAFAIAFPKAIPNEVDERTQKSLKQIYNDNEQLADGFNEESVSTSLDEESALVQSFYRLPLLNQLYPLILKSGLREKLSSFVVVYFALTLALILLMLQANLALLGLFAGPVGAFFLLKMYFQRKVRKRNDAFINAFPDVLDTFVRSIKSGFPVTSAFRVIAENMDPPVSTEFQRIVNELAMGQSMHSVLTRLAERIDEPDIHFFVIVMKVQQEAGGNLAEVVSNLSNVIRKRKHLRMKIRALTSEGRMTAYILGSLPILVFFALYMAAQDYVAVLWTDSAGMLALGGAISLIAGCMITVNKMVAIDI